MHPYSFKALQWYQVWDGEPWFRRSQIGKQTNCKTCRPTLKKPCSFIFSIIQPSIFKSLLIPSWWAHKHSKSEFQRGVVTWAHFYPSKMSSKQVLFHPTPCIIYSLYTFVFNGDGSNKKFIILCSVDHASISLHCQDWKLINTWRNKYVGVGWLLRFVIMPYAFKMC